MTAAPLPDPQMYVGPCECGGHIYRRTKSGIPPKRCHECRIGTFGGKRPELAGQLLPTIEIRRWMRTTRAKQESAGAGSPGATMHLCAAVAVAEATGLDDKFAESIISAVCALVERGETDLMIRCRLNPRPNPNPGGFGERPAGRGTKQQLAELLGLEEND